MARRSGSQLPEHFRHTVPVGTPIAGYGPCRLIRDVLAIPGSVLIEDDRLVELCLSLDSHPLAPLLADLLPRRWQ